MIIVVLLALIFIIYMLIPTYVKPRVYDELITEEEREHIMKVARDKLKTSTVEEGVNRRIDNKVRVSETAFLCPKDDPIVERVMRRCLRPSRSGS